MYSHVIFDIDGTLIDSSDAIFDAFKQGYHELGLKYPGDTSIKNLFGHKLEDILVQLEIDEKFLIDFRNIFAETMIKTKKLKIFPGIKPILDYLINKGMTLQAVTSKQKKTADHALRFLNLSKFFEFVITADDVNNAKPDPEPLIKACYNLNEKPSNKILFIGDTITDHQAARNAGLSFLGVTWGEHPKLIQKNANDYVTSTNELLNYIVKYTR